MTPDQAHAQAAASAFGIEADFPAAPCPVEYVRLAKENELRYGTEWRRIGGMLLADRYSERTHFIYELLQNAEDALRRLESRSGSRSIKFELSESCLRVSHFGRPFDEPDVRGVCGISESTKGLTAIGRFGIGFKSVYAFTDRPEVHSGAEDFAIEDYVRPVVADPVERMPNETVILIPLRTADDLPIIALGLASLGPNALLFLREIDQIEWTVKGGASGLYLRDQPTSEDETARMVKVIGEQAGKEEVDEDWLVFSRPMQHAGGELAGHVELAFRLKIDPTNESRRVQRIPRSMLNVFFPTVVETHLGFLLQGPLRTTPSRDAVPQADEWNIHCVQTAGELLADALRWLRAHQMLDVSALNSLPLDRTKFEGGMFAPLHEQVKTTLSTESLLPGHQGGCFSAKQALLARGQDLRDLLDKNQLGELFPEAHGRGWLVSSITQDRTPELRQYLLRELSVMEVGPETLLGRLKPEFLERQPDAWVERLYVFLGGQPALRAPAARLPLVRLTDGSHVQPHLQGVPQAFLAGSFQSGFPTVRPEVCREAAAVSFLKALGLTVPDRVDDVIRNILPKYRKEGRSLTMAEYASDIGHIAAAFKTDSRTQRERLVTDLQATAFVLSISTDGAKRVLARPSITVLATERLKELLSGIPGALVVDDREKCLQGQEVRDLLESCGATRHLRLVEAPEIDWKEKSALREKAGHAATSGQNDRVNDFALSGLKEIIAKLATLDLAGQRRQSEFLWEELALIEDRRGKGVFSAEYTWTHHGSYKVSFPSAFVRALNEMAWVPGASGGLYPPGAVLFESLGWKPDAFLLTQIRFKPPIIAQLEQEAGFEPGALDLLKQLGLTNTAELRARLGIKDTPPPSPPDDDQGHGGNDASDANQPDDASSSATSPPGKMATDESDERAGTLSASDGSSGMSHGNLGRPTIQPAKVSGPDVTGSPCSTFVRPQQPSDQRQTDQYKPDADSSEQPNQRVFVSFVAVQPDEPAEDPDGLSHRARMDLEEAAIAFILTQEPNWQRTPPNNPGYDLVKSSGAGEPCTWCEVKAMTGSLDDRPVCISRTQFEFAQRKGINTWLYIVERAGSAQANIVRIQDPAGQARTFTFDHGWRAVAAPIGDGACGNL